jgi:plastocyanin
MMRRTPSLPLRFGAAAAAVALVVTLTACGGDDDDDDGGASATDAAPTSAPADNGGGGDNGDDQVAVTIEDFEFDAQPVAAGSEFEVENRDSAEHTFTADDGEFGVTIEGGDSEDVTAPSDPGTYAFHCEIHPNMTGELTVE